MRLRFFLIIFSVLAIATVLALVVHEVFLSQDRMAQIDQHVRNTASSLIDLELHDLRKMNFFEQDKVIADELGQSQNRHPFVIRSEDGTVLFESVSAKKFKLRDAPTSPQWLQFEQDGRFFRVLNLKLPQMPDRRLQVALAIDASTMRPAYFSSRAFWFAGAMLVLGIGASLLLTSYLLRPLAHLGGFLISVADDDRMNHVLPDIPAQLVPRSVFYPRDEYARLLGGFRKLIQRVNQNYKFTRLWAYQMAHELKTPLSILHLELELLHAAKKITDEELHRLNAECAKTSETINSFLAWAELENLNAKPELYANHLSPVTESSSRRYETLYPGRIVLELANDPLVLASPQHLEQLITNLVGNALQHSTGTVRVAVNGQELSVHDQGAGIPDSVRQRLGEPFNRGESSPSSSGKSSGLGLAWVTSICRLYAWKMDVQTSAQGSKITVRFPVFEEIVTPKIMKYSSPPAEARV